MASEKVKAPENVSADWQALDIFVFSNGQQYSPPRKYHLRSEDLNWWKSTLNFLARTQYGTLHSYIDLYTIDGKKIVSPLELSNGTSYVAVAPHDRFVEAGYDKYLIRASRSWEKRQAKRTSIADADKTKNQVEIAHLDVKVDNPNNDESMDLKTIVPSMVDHETSVIVQPQPPSPVQRKLEPLHATPARLGERKRSSVQRPSITRKSTPPTPPVPNMKTAFKKKDSIRTGNVKITRPENERKSSSVSSANQASKIQAKSKIYNHNSYYQPTTNPKESSIPPKTNNVASELKSSSSIKIITKNDTNLLNNNDFNNVTEGKEVILVSNIYQNPRRDMPSVAVDPNLIPLIAPVGKHTLTAVPVENVLTVTQKDAENLDNLIQEIKTAIMPNFENVDSSPRKNSVMTNKIPDDRCTTYAASYKVKDDLNTNNEIIITTTDNKENIKVINAPPPRRISIMTDKLSVISDGRHSSQVVAHDIVQCQNIKNNINISTDQSYNNTKIHNIPTSKQPSVGTKVSNTHETYVVPHNVNENVNLNHEVSTNAPEILKPDFTSTLHLTNKPSDNRCFAVLNKGDSVNLKLNIEIQNYDGGLIKISDNANLHPVSNIQRTEKESQININQIVVQKNSLLSLIAKEINDRHIGDNHFFIIVQCSGCKYCDDQKITMPDNNVNKNYMILLPVKKFGDNILRCYCDRSQHEIQHSSVINPVKATFSCMSIERLTKLNQELPVESFPQVIITQDRQPINAVELETKQMDKDVITVLRKKSVTIHKESILNSRESSKNSQDIKSEVITVSKEFIEVLHRSVVGNSTQTEWCEVLLEAKLMEDGHYTFRLPSLEKLKSYRLV